MLHTRINDRVRADDRLKETHDQKFNTIGKLVRDEYKRFTFEQEQAVYEANAQIILEKQAMKQMEKEAETQQDSDLQSACNLMGQLDSLVRDQAKERLKKTVAQNKESAA